MHVAIFGATGLVGQTIHNLLIQRCFPFTKLSLFASSRSVNDTIQDVNDADWTNIDLAFFAAGSEVSRTYIPLALDAKTTVIDSSSAFRETAPLVIPEINCHLIENAPLIASPNCTASIMLMALHPLHAESPIKRIVASTYQAASGGGQSMMDQLIDNPLAFPLHLHDSFTDSLYSGEEQKVIFETRKILNTPHLPISIRCVRVPVLRAHSISLNIEFENTIDPKVALANAQGIQLMDRPTPMDATGIDDVLCGSIRPDPYHPNTFEMWVVGDQLLKGAALNAVQIGEKVFRNYEKCGFKMGFCANTTFRRR